MKSFKLKILQNYKRCVYCNSKKLQREKNSKIILNFYTKAIKLDLNLSESFLQNIKQYKCLNCKIIQNSPWFTKNISKKIYSNIYGQHNRNWKNLFNFINYGILPDHGALFELIRKKVSIKKYGEFNAPFMGLMLNLFKNETKNNKSFYKNYSKNIFKYLISRQVFQKSKKTQLDSIERGTIYLNKFKSLLKKNQIKKKQVKKIIFKDDNTLSWGVNDNYNSVNSLSFATEFFNSNYHQIEEIKNFKKFDLIGIFHSLDHTFNPRKILNLALKHSKYVLVYAHINKNITKQHLFSLTENFLDYLKNNNIYCLNLNNQINKKFKSPEIYFICSLNKHLINKFN